MFKCDLLVTGAKGWVVGGGWVAVVGGEWVAVVGSESPGPPPPPCFHSF